MQPLNPRIYSYIIICPFFCGTVCLWFSGLRWAPGWILTFSYDAIVIAQLSTTLWSSIPIAIVSPLCLFQTPQLLISPRLHIWTFSSAVRCTTTARLLSAGGWTSSVVKPTVANQIQWRKGCMEGGIGFYIPWLSTHCLHLVSPRNRPSRPGEAAPPKKHYEPWLKLHRGIHGTAGWSVMVGEATARAKADGGIWAYWLVRGPYHQYASGIWGTELLHALTYHTHTHIYIYIQLDDIWCSLINSKHIFWGSYGDLIAFGLLVSIAQSLMQLRCGSLCLSIPASALGSAWQCP